ncbi:bis(5'-nucleosyl)-tetraphosphatase (symmetrical) YqeK [Enterococcus sp.]|uniref:bis(5'-nucleosyl)-tetraphosphatase (symmetrical) YqeK n=1 Tax=Enterococcus sp. TaxID=35783 RepID=UPI0025C1CFB9|nr:bis(5'-nucleosyl)-tetraphosphatase (symmetrical) YqeK [Enterococcus sp.]
MIADYRVDLPDTTLIDQMHRYLEAFDHIPTIQHHIEVAHAAEQLAQRFSGDAPKAFVAGLFHDISVVIPNEKRVAFQEQLGLAVLPEERQVPLLLHQKQSAVLAKEIFGITDPEILSAIACHTTLKADFSKLDLIVFLADKIKWDRADAAPFLEDLLEALDDSLEAAALCYIDWLFASDLLVAHPWAVAAKKQLESNHL